MNRAPNKRLQRTRAAVLLQFLRGDSARHRASGRAPLSRDPLADTKTSRDCR